MNILMLQFIGYQLASKAGGADYNGIAGASAGNMMPREGFAPHSQMSHISPVCWSCGQLTPET